MKYLLLSMLSIGMLHAMELKIEQVGKYADGSGYWASLKDTREISTSVDKEGKIRCTVYSIPGDGGLYAGCNSEIEEDGDPAWYTFLKDEYEKRQLSATQENKLETESLIDKFKLK